MLILLLIGLWPSLILLMRQRVKKNMMLMAELGKTCLFAKLSGPFYPDVSHVIHFLLQTVEDAFSCF
jgi:hypothetical protein